MYQAQLRDMLALRDGSLRHLELFKITGIVSFPSFHAASAALYTWRFGRCAMSAGPRSSSTS